MAREPVDPERYERICEMVDEVLALPPGQRSPYLQQACGGDDDLRWEVESLVAMESNQDEPSRPGDRVQLTEARITEDGIFGHLERLAASQPAAAPQYPERIGDYRILETLGSGGMGVVFLAEQREPVKRRVALKLIHTSLQSRHAQMRFDAERNALARLNHPHVAQLYEAGRSDDGFPFFAMEYLPAAEPLTKYCDLRQLSIAERLRLFVQVCHGVHHAHQKGVLHRDLKPGNVLVVELEGSSEPHDRGVTEDKARALTAVPKVIDFGLAKALDGLPLAGATGPTGRSAVGTPEYMSPEARSAARDVDTRSDVYSLGVLLHELLTGTRPGAANLSGAEPVSTPRPSSLLSGLDREAAGRVATERRSSRLQLERRIRGDLDWIVLRTLAFEPDRRYSSAAELAADIERHLANQPILAHPPEVRYLASRFVRRHRGPVLATVTVLLTLVGGLVARTLEARRANEETRRAQVALAEAQELSSFLVQLFEEADPTLNRQKPLTVRELLDRGTKSLSSSFSDQSLTRARFLSLLGDIYDNLGHSKVAEPLLSEALELQKRHGDAERREIILTLSRLGAVKRNLGQLEEAKGHYQQALEIAEENAGRQSSQVAAILRRLYVLERNLGDPGGAESLLLEALDIEQKVGSPNSELLALIYTSLGNHYQTHGRSEDAERLLLQAREVLQQSHGQEHLNLAAILVDLASIYLGRQQLDKAEELYLEAAHIQERTLGDHPRLATTLNNLASTYRTQERFDAAEPLMRRALSIWERFREEDHPDIAIGLNNLGTFYWWLGRYDEAEPLYRRALAIQDKKLRPGHSHRGLAMTNLGLTHWKQGRHAEAEALLRRGLGIVETALGPEHSVLALTLVGLAGNTRDQGLYEDAEPLYERSLTLLSDSTPAADPVLRLALNDFAALLRATGRDERAAALEARATSEDTASQS